MARVFISYARTDAEVAGRVRGWLVDAGHEVFLDRDVDAGIRVGEDWQERLHERLRWADAVVCLVSAASVASAWCVGEVATALSRGSRVLPLQVEPGVRHPLLTRLQHEAVDRDDGDARARLAAGCGWWMPGAGRGGRMTGRRFRVCGPSMPTSIGCSSAAAGRWRGWRRCCAHRPNRSMRGVAGGGAVGVWQVVAGAGRVAAGDGGRAGVVDGGAAEARRRPGGGVGAGVDRRVAGGRARRGFRRCGTSWIGTGCGGGG